MKLWGISVRTNPQSYTADIPQLWGRYFAECSPDLSHRLYCVYTDYETDHTGPYTCIIGQTTARESLQGFDLEIPAADHQAVFTANGNMSSAVHDQWLLIWKDATLKRAYTVDYELYEPARIADPTNISVDIFVAVV